MDMLQKRNLRGRALIDHKKTLHLTTEQREILIGTLLGDASMSTRNGKPAYTVKFEQGEAHRGYVYHLHEIFEPFVASPVAERFIDKARTRRAFYFRTYRHKELIFYFNFFYKIQAGSKRVKVVPKTIHKFLTPRALAYWFMDDGTYRMIQENRAYLLSTQGFQRHEVERLCNALELVFNIRANLQKDRDKWKIYIPRQYSDTFVDIIRPYIHDDFLYKLDSR